jgi:hypothetical protein
LSESGDGVASRLDADRRIEYRQVNAGFPEGGKALGAMP